MYKIHLKVFNINSASIFSEFDLYLKKWISTHNLKNCVYRSTLTIVLVTDMIKGHSLHFCTKR